MSLQENELQLVGLWFVDSQNLEITGKVVGKVSEDTYLVGWYTEGDVSQYGLVCLASMYDWTFSTSFVFFLRMLDELKSQQKESA